MNKTMIRYNYTHLSHILTTDDIKIFSKLFFCCKEDLDNKYYTDDYGDKNIPKCTFHNMYSVIVGFEEKREYILYYDNMHLYFKFVGFVAAYSQGSSYPRMACLTGSLHRL